MEDELLEVEDKVDDEVLLENANAELVFQLIEELPTQQKLVLNMFVMEDFSHKEIANRLTISEGASRSLVQRAKINIKKMLGQEVQNEVNNNGR